MVVKTIDDIRQLIDPQGYIEALQQGRNQLQKTLSSLVADYDLTSDTPELNEDDRKVALDRQMSVLRDCVWRMEEIDRRLDNVTSTPNRAERRRSRKD